MSMHIDEEMAKGEMIFPKISENVDFSLNMNKSMSRKSTTDHLTPSP